MQGFQDMYGIPHTLGAVDGTHISIHKPPINHPTAPGSLFYNRKGYYSINCQMICDAKSRITSVNPNFPGSTHDAAIWQSSNVHQYLKDQYVDHRPMEWLLGDKGYPLLPWLMTPLAEVGAGTGRKVQQNAFTCKSCHRNDFWPSQKHISVPEPPPHATL
ncbi:DDE superfamily endonuclease domain-containing protein [Phthorimaea operculella]|nr:DDE superfamily endonuclease domain-containing protein [Phthorimaea operculella]